MQENDCKIGYKSLNDGKELLVECLENNDDLKKNYLSAFKSIAKIHKLFFKEDSNDEEIENLAKECEFFLDNIPKWFPLMDITRKMYDLGMILPIFIRREKQMMFKFLSAEERGESLHRLFNEFERQFCSISYKPI